MVVVPSGATDLFTVDSSSSHCGDEPYRLSRVPAVLSAEIARGWWSCPPSARGPSGPDPLIEKIPARGDTYLLGSFRICPPHRGAPPMTTALRAALAFALLAGFYVLVGLILAAAVSFDVWLFVDFHS